MNENKSLRYQLMDIRGLGDFHFLDSGIDYGPSKLVRSTLLYTMYEIVVLDGDTGFNIWTHKLYDWTILTNDQLVNCILFL